MGSKHASIHLRCDDSSEIVEKLKEEFGAKQGPDQGDLMAMQLIKAFASKNIAAISDPKERAQKEAILNQVMGQASMGDEEVATIVVREYFVSIYWYDHIRCENLRKMLTNYARRYKTAALGVAVYDDSNFQIYGIGGITNGAIRICQGEYLFDYEDITPVDAEEVCEVIEAPFFLDALKKALACEDGEEMAAAFENGTGLPIFMDDEMCRAAGMRELHKLAGATIFSAVE